MNNPAYILVDVLGDVTAAVKLALNLPVLNYQYGYISELNETLSQWSKSQTFQGQRFPLIWVAQPFTINRNQPAGLYGSVEGLKIAVVVDSNKTLKARDRMEQKFRPILYPIYQELMNQLNMHEAISYDASRRHKITDRYYWGAEQQSTLTDVVDCLILDQVQIIVNNNSNCIPFKG